MINVETVPFMDPTLFHQMSPSEVAFYYAILMLAVVAVIHLAYLAGCTVARWIAYLTARGVAGAAFAAGAVFHGPCPFCNVMIRARLSHDMTAILLYSDRASPSTELRRAQDPPLHQESLTPTGVGSLSSPDPL